MTDKKVFQLPEYKGHYYDGEMPSHVYPCIRCGKPVVRPEKAWIVEVVEGGAALSIPGEGDEQDDGYMAYYPLGNECAKHIPAEFRRRP